MENAPWPTSLARCVGHYITDFVINKDKSSHTKTIFDELQGSGLSTDFLEFVHGIYTIFTDLSDSIYLSSLLLMLRWQVSHTN